MRPGMRLLGKVSDTLVSDTGRIFSRSGRISPMARLLPPPLATAAVCACLAAGAAARNRETSGLLWERLLSATSRSRPGQRVHQNWYPRRST